MRLSDSGRRLIKGFEGCSLKAYKDADGYSIGYGHFGAKLGDVITQQTADQLFDLDVARFESSVSSTLGGATTQAQFDACVSLAYNIGTGAFEGSTLARKHKSGDFAGAAGEFPRWNKSQGAVHPGLVMRRTRERAVYEGSSAPSSGGSAPSSAGGGVSSFVPVVARERPLSDAPAPSKAPTVPPGPRRRATGNGGAMGVLVACFFLPLFMSGKRRK